MHSAWGTRELAEKVALRQALKDELEFARHTTRQEHSKRREQLEDRQGRGTVHGAFGGWQVGSIRERGRMRR